MRAASNAPRKRRLRIPSRHSAISMPQPATCISIGSTKLRRRSSEPRTGRYRGPISPPGIFTSRSSEGTTQPWNGSSRGPKVTTSEPELTHFKALALARSGQLERAGSLARRAVDLSEKARQPERAAVFQTAPSRVARAHRQRRGGSSDRRAGTGHVDRPRRVIRRRLRAGADR